MESFEKWQVIIGISQTGILVMTFLGALYIGLKQNEINQNLLNVGYTDLQPILAFHAEYNDPFKFKNVGKGPAFNIVLFQGNREGKILINPDKFIITAISVEESGVIPRKELVETNLEVIKKSYPEVCSEVKQALESKVNWIALLYQDLNGKKFFSIIFGEIGAKNPAMKYLKL